MNIRWVYILFLLLLATVLVFDSCTKEFDEYYQVPDDLIGTVLDVLEEDGNYTQFIKAVERVEFDDVLGRTGNFTVFAPDDDAFTEFLAENGYSALEDIPEEELESIVYYHIVFWAYSKFMLQYGLGIQDVEIEYSTASFKQPTRYVPPTGIEYDTLGRRYTVYHETKFIPVFTEEYFTELDLSGSANYLSLYPNSNYGGFNVDRAEVVEADVPAQNGWIHKIDKVLKAPNNHDDILEKNPEYSVFRELLEENTYFQYSSSYTTSQDNEGDVNEDGVLDSLFLKMNEIFPPGSSPDIENVNYNGQQNVITLFAPTNSALESFFTNHTSGYSSIYEIGEYWMDWYLSHYIGSNYWPSEFSTLTEDWAWDVTVNYENSNINEADIHHLQMASNGPFCGINKFLLPKIYESVLQPIIGNKDYEWFCNMVVFYLADKLLSEEGIEFTIFAPSNAAIGEARYSFRDGIAGFGLYSFSNPLNTVPREEATDIVNSHIVFGEMNEDDFEAGTFIESAQNTVIGVTEEGIYSGGDLNISALGEPEIVSGKGVIYPVDRMLVSSNMSIFDMLYDRERNPEYQKFYQLCYESGLLDLYADGTPFALDNITVGKYYTCLIPTNQAINIGLADGIIPSDADSLRQFLRYHFIEEAIFADGKKTGMFTTTRYDDEDEYENTTIEVVNQKDDLKIKDNMGNIRNVITSNRIAQDGVIHQIDSLLLYY